MFTRPAVDTCSFDFSTLSLSHVVVVLVATLPSDCNMDVCLALCHIYGTVVL